LVCLPRSSGFQRFLSDDDGLFFDDADDLARQLERAFADGSWKARARKGKQTYLSLFNETRVAQYIVDAVMGADLSQYEWHDI
ncbi:MAG: glycosyltransferase, partial [Pseudomonadota bacterium]